MPNIHPKQKLMAAAEALLSAASPLIGIEDGAELAAVPDSALHELRAALEANRLPDLDRSDPDYHRKLGARTSGNRTKGPKRNENSAKGGRATKGIRKPGSGRWPKGSKGHKRDPQPTGEGEA
jgi:hypothetical protein